MTRGTSSGNQPALGPLTRRHVVAGLATAPLLAASPAWPQAIGRGGSLVVAIGDNPPHLLTGISVDILTICVAGQIYDTRARSGQRAHVAIGADRNKTSVSDRNRLPDREIAIDGNDLTAA